MNTDRKDALETILNTAYNDVINAIRASNNAGQRVTDAKTSYELAKTAKIISGEITGKNETERKASEATLLAGEIDAVKSAERHADMQRLELSLDQLEAERVRWLIRLELGVAEVEQ